MNAKCMTGMNVILQSIPSSIFATVQRAYRFCPCQGYGLTALLYTPQSASKRGEKYGIMIVKVG